MAKNNNSYTKLQRTWNPILYALIISGALALLVTLAIWSFELRSVVKWLLRAGFLAIPFTALLYFIYFRKRTYVLKLEKWSTLLGIGISLVFALQLVPSQITPARTLIVNLLTAGLFFTLFIFILEILTVNADWPLRKIVTGIILLSGIIGMGLIFDNSLNARLYSDDLCYAVNFDQLGFPDAAFFFYNDWSGRFFTNFLVMGFTDQPRTITYLLILTILSLIFAELLTSKTENGSRKWWQSIAAALFITLSISIVTPDFYKSFFWICSALILFPVFIISPLYLAIMLRLMQGKSKKPMLMVILGALLSFSLATTHEAASLGWLAMNAFGLIWSKIAAKRNKKLQIFFMVGCLATLIGLVVLLASPGVENRAQIQQYPGSTPILQTIPIVFSNFIEFVQNITVPYYAYEMNGRPGWLLLLGVFGIAYMFGLPLKRKCSSALIVVGITIVMILGTSFPAAYVFRGNIPRRTQMIPVFFLTLGTYISASLLPKPKKQMLKILFLCSIPAEPPANPRD